MMHIGKIYPIQLNEKTAYLAGVIIGDGYISGSFKTKNGRSYRISIDLIDFEFISTIAALIKQVVKTTAKIRELKIRDRCQATWSFAVSNKSLWYFFTETLKVPFGAKSRLVNIPEKIRNSAEPIKRQFLAGLFDTDGGLRSECIGLTSASPVMCEQVAFLFRELGFECNVSSWVIKNYNWRYYGLRLRRRDIDRFLKEIPLRNEGKKAAIAKRFNIAAVPKWSNGPESIIDIVLGQI